MEKAEIINFEKILRAREAILIGERYRKMNITEVNKIIVRSIFQGERNESALAEEENLEPEMTFDEMIKIEPQLGILRDEAIQRSNELPDRAWAKRSEVWYDEFKPRFIKLVGFMAEKPELRTSEIYSAVYEEFIKILRCE